MDLKEDDKEAKKTKEVIAKIKHYLKNGISPSALNTYIACPLDFYYKYILKLKYQDDIAEHV